MSASVIKLKLKPRPLPVQLYRGSLGTQVKTPNGYLTRAGYELAQREHPELGLPDFWDLPIYAGDDPELN